MGEIGTPRVPFTQFFISGIGLKCSAKDVKLLLIQFGGAELSIFDRLPHTKFSLPNFEVDGVVSNNYEKCLYALDRLAKESVYRYHKIKEAGLKTIEEYNRKSEEKMPYIVCVVEYPHNLEKRDIPVVQDYINQITNFSEETGICFVYTLNRLKTKSVESEEYELLTQTMCEKLSSKMIFRLPENEMFKDFMIDGEDYFEVRKHWFVKQNKIPIKTAMPIIDSKEICEIIKSL